MLRAEGISQFHYIVKLFLRLANALTVGSTEKEGQSQDIFCTVLYDKCKNILTSFLSWSCWKSCLSIGCSLSRKNNPYLKDWKLKLFWKILLCILRNYSIVQQMQFTQFWFSSNQSSCDLFKTFFHIKYYLLVNPLNGSTLLLTSKIWHYTE